MEHQDATRRFDEQIRQEWLISNGIGGYASSTVLGCNTRKYHGLLVAAMSPPVRRMVILSRVEETVIHRGWPSPLSCSEYPGTIHPEGHLLLQAFNDDAYPRWGYQGDGWTLVKQLHLLRGRNAVCVRYILLGQASDVELEVKPLFALRSIHQVMNQWSGQPPVRQIDANHLHVQPTRKTPEVFIAHDGAFTNEPLWYYSNLYRHEPERGYNGLEDLWLPGSIRWKLKPGEPVNLVVSTEPIDLAATLREVEIDDAPPVPLHGLAVDTTPALDTLVRAAGTFVLRLESETIPPIITNYPWSAPLMREALIGFSGLFLTTGRFEQARTMLLALASHERDGLLPSMFPEDGAEPPYDAPDVSLWYVQAVYDYFRYTRDEKTLLDRLMPVVERILDAFSQGTVPGVTLADGGLVRTAAGATWMNAAITGRYVTPREGCAVEVNALAYNALRIGTELAQLAGRPTRAATWNASADVLASAFMRQFWNEADGCCYDVVDGEQRDASLRPNQLLAVALPFPVLDACRHARVVQVMAEHLLTPLGLRTLAPTDSRFIPRKAGNEAARANARHQGTVYPWLLGPFAAALARLHGRSVTTRRQIEQLLQPCIQYMQTQGRGQLCELFDGAPPHAPGGAIAAAASVGQVLSAYVEHVLCAGPSADPLIESPPLGITTFPVTPKTV